MKKLIVSFTFGLITLVFSTKLYAQSEETRAVSGFNAISSAGPFNIRVKINGTESLKINAEKDILPEIQTFVENHELRIKFKKNRNYHFNGQINIYVSAKSLISLSNAGSGFVNVEEGSLSGNKTSLSIAGSGDITAGIKSEHLNISIAGSGSAHIKGSTNKLDVSIAGSGSVQGKELKSASCEVSIAGSGNVYVIASNKIEANIIGSGSVYYSGSASVESNTLGSGRVRKLN